MKVAITGGIGSGKSYVCRCLNRIGITVYDCDSAAKRLIRSSADIKQALTRLIGNDTYTADGQLNKAAVAQFLLASSENAKAINHIVHPAVAADFQKSGEQWIESAILFESGFDRLVKTDYVIAVTAPEELRIKRIMQRDGITREKACQWISRQWPQNKVVARADFEIVNDGIKPIEKQLRNIIKQITF